MARKKNTRRLRNVTPTIIGAGITEQWYFTHLVKLFGYRFKIRPRFFGREDIDSIRRKIEDVLSNEGYAICVFDADVTQWDASAYKKLAQLKKDYEKNENVLLCDSMPSIEYWFLLHYKNTNKYFKTSENVIKELRKFITNYDKTASFLGKIDWVDLMSKDGKLELAKTRAEAFRDDGESWSNVWKVIE